MWMLSFIPDALLIWAINAVLLIGIAGTAVSIMFKLAIRYFPWIIPYRLLLQVVSVILLVLGVYLKGGYAVEAEWRARVAELEAKLQLLNNSQKKQILKYKQYMLTELK
jgi:hypothetical protein